MFHVLRAHQPENARPTGEPQNEDNGQHALLVEHRCDCQHQQNVRNRAENRIEPVQSIVGLAAEVARQCAEKCAENCRDDGRGESHQNRRFRALNHFAQNVAAPFIRAKRQEVQALLFYNLRGTIARATELLTKLGHYIG